MTRTVVTGGAGFLGSHLCEQLLADGHEVLALDNFLTGTPANVEHLLQNDRFRLVKADITDYVHVPGPVDAVLHFASPASPIDYLLLPIETMKVGSIGTLHALGLAKEKGARFLLASTSETYGDPQVHPQPESYWGHVNPVGPRGVYDEAKRFAEALTMAYRRTHGVDTAIVRIFNSVLADEQLLYDDGETLHRTTAAELATRLGMPASGGAVPLHGWRVPCFDAASSVSPSQASWLVAHPTTQQCYQVRTRYGRSVQVTGDHSLFVRGSDGSPQARHVSQLAIGDHVALAGTVEVPERDRVGVDLLDVVAGIDPWTVVVTHPDLRATAHQHRRQLLEAWLRHRGHALSGPSRSSAWATVTRWQVSGAVPLGALRSCRLAVPADAAIRLGKQGVRSALPRRIPLSDDLLWLLGLYLARGRRFERAGKRALDLCGDGDTLDRAHKIVERDLGLPVRRVPASSARAGRLVLHCGLLLRLLDHLGFDAGPKALPGWVLGLPRQRLGHVLEGYREGAGVHCGQPSDTAVRHEFSTVSERLKDDLVVAFARFGLVASVGRYSSTLDEGTGARRHPGWRLTLCQVSPWSPLDWHRGVTQQLDARRTGDLVWARVEQIVPVPATELVYDFVVPGRENFWAGGLWAHNTHGPRMRPHDGRAIPAFASQALTGQPITVAGDGSQTRSIIYVDDLVAGILKLLRSDLPGPVNIGNPHEVSVLHLAETIRTLTGSSSEIVFIDRPTDDPTVRQPDITLARTALGWEPTVAFQDGLQRTIAWFRSHPALVG